MKIPDGETPTDQRWLRRRAVKRQRIALVGPGLQAAFDTGLPRRGRCQFGVVNVTAPLALIPGRLVG